MNHRSHHQEPNDSQNTLSGTQANAMGGRSQRGNFLRGSLSALEVFGAFSALPRIEQLEVMRTIERTNPDVTIIVGGKSLTGQYTVPQQAAILSDQSLLLSGDAEVLDYRQHQARIPIGKRPSIAKVDTSKDRYTQVINPPVVGKIPRNRVFVDRQTGWCYTGDGRLIQLDSSGHLRTISIRSGKRKGEVAYATLQPKAAVDSKRKKPKPPLHGHNAGDWETPGRMSEEEEKSTADGAEFRPPYLEDWGDEYQMVSLPDKLRDGVLKKFRRYVSAKARLDEQLIKDGLRRCPNPDPGKGKPPELILDREGLLPLSYSREINLTIEALKRNVKAYTKACAEAYKSLGIKRRKRRMTRFIGTGSYRTPPGVIGTLEQAKAALQATTVSATKGKPVVESIDTSTEEAKQDTVEPSTSKEN